MASAPEQPASVRQVHSPDVLLAKEPGLAGVGDALITATPGVLLGIKTADCVPVLLADIRNHAVAAVHAGWRGTAANIVSRTLDAMKREWGTVPENIIAAIGPAIGECCFEVGPEVARVFSGFHPPFAEAEGKQHLDLSEINRWQLKQCGIPAANIESAGLCTFCHSDRFFSYRRDREEAGRMWSVIKITK